MDTEDDAWADYPTRIEGEPASILVNLRYRDDRPVGPDTFYAAAFVLREPGGHGMGVGADVDELREIDREIVVAATTAGFLDVGRVRGRGEWRLVFYGTAGGQPALEAIVARLAPGREHEVHAREDPAWSFYDGFLAPDAERWRWIQDRHLVEAMAEHGDVHAKPRPVDHHADFADATDGRAFADAASALGFTAHPEEDAEGRHAVHLIRVDPVVLEHIHKVVMQLVDLAEANGGDYGGWGAPTRTSDD